GGRLADVCKRVTGLRGCLGDPAYLAPLTPVLAKHPQNKGVYTRHQRGDAMLLTGAPERFDMLYGEVFDHLAASRRTLMREPADRVPPDDQARDLQRSQANMR